MSFEVLCAPYFPASEAAALDEAARKMSVTPDELVRKAVGFFIDQCVPTQENDAIPDESLLR